jgi:hypothetical protein
MLKVVIILMRLETFEKNIRLKCTMNMKNTLMTKASNHLKFNFPELLFKDNDFL